MQKISSYLYPNRIQLLADLAGFTTEFTNVYQRTIKIYRGVDNVLEFDIKNADQKRIGLVDTVDPAYTSPITDIMLNIMDAEGNALPNSPYTVIPLGLKGIASATIPAADLDELKHQYLRYTVTATKDTATIPLYADTRFGATGTIELVGDAMPVVRNDRVYSSFTSEIDLKGVPTWHSSAIPTTFYEAVRTTQLSFDVSLKGLTGSVWVEAIKDTTVSVDSFKKANILASSTVDNFTGNWTPSALTIGDYKYFRVSYQTPNANGIGATFTVVKDNNLYTVTVKSGGTGYAVASQIKILGSVLGGTDGVNDLIIEVTGVDAASGQATSSYSISSIMSVDWTGTASNGNATYIVSGTNITGTVDKVTVS